MKPHEIQEKLGLTRIRDRNWYVQPSCATTGDGLFEGLTWLTSNHKSWGSSIISEVLFCTCIWEERRTFYIACFLLQRLCPCLASFHPFLCKVWNMLLFSCKHNIVILGSQFGKWMKKSSIAIAISLVNTQLLSDSAMIFEFI